MNPGLLNDSSIRDSSCVLLERLDRPEKYALDLLSKRWALGDEAAKDFEFGSFSSNIFAGVGRLFGVVGSLIGVYCGDGPWKSQMSNVSCTSHGGTRLRWFVKYSANAASDTRNEYPSKCDLQITDEPEWSDEEKSLGFVSYISRMLIADRLNVFFVWYNETKHDWFELACACWSKNDALCDVLVIESLTESSLGRPIDTPHCFSMRIKLSSGGKSPSTTRTRLPATYYH